jgi:predicted RNA binding protein YcfA (HicA-like mRNA interferase family)
LRYTSRPRVNRRRNWSLSECSESLSPHEQDSAAVSQGDHCRARQGGLRDSAVKGSHHFLKHPDGRKTVVPVHSGETIGPGLLLKILRTCEIDLEQLDKLLR